MREIVPDTETAGLDPLDGHRPHLWLRSRHGASCKERLETMPKRVELDRHRPSE